jgi:uncharacterized protein
VLVKQYNSLFWRGKQPQSIDLTLFYMNRLTGTRFLLARHRLNPDNTRQKVSPMELYDDSSAENHLIRAYAEGEITVNNTVVRDSLVLMPDQLHTDWPPACLADLNREHIAFIAGLEPQIVLLGTGNTLQFPDNALLTPLMECHIGMEIMDTAAACRTYNLLVTEGRRVAAALFMIRG